MISRSGAGSVQIMVVDMIFMLVAFAAKPSLDTMMGTDGNEAGTLFHTTLDISSLLLYKVNWYTTAAF